MLFRSAVREDLEEINQVILLSKQHWNYPADWIELFRAELLRDENILAANIVVVLELNCAIIGLYSLDTRTDPLDLDDFWLLPEYIGQGKGRALFNHMIDRAREENAKELRIVSDPHAEGFYRKMGARRVGQEASRIRGRFLPVLSFQLTD